MAMGRFSTSFENVYFKETDALIGSFSLLGFIGGFAGARTRKET